MAGPDHAASLEPSEFAQMVTSIRRVEQALGRPRKVVTKAEFQNRDVIRKSIVARIRIEEGELFSEENLAVLRPGTGLSPMRWTEVIGQPALQRYMPNEKINLK